MQIKNRVAVFAAVLVPMAVITGGLAYADADKPDTTAPVLSSTGLTDGDWLPRHATLTPVYSDDVAVTKVQVLLNGAVVATHEGTLPREIKLTTPTSVHREDASLTVRAFDAAGNKGELTTKVKGDILSPDIVVSPALKSVVSGVVTLTATEVRTYGEPIGDLARVELLDETGKVLSEATAAPWEFTWDTKGLNGDVYRAFRFYDRAGNGGNHFGEFHVDNAGPSIGKITPAQNALVRGTVKTTVQATDVSGIRSARVKGGQATKSPLTWTVKPTRQGPYTIEWTVTDKLGHTTVARRTVVNDTVKPKLDRVKAPKNGAKVKGVVKVTASATDANGIARVELLVNGKVVATDKQAGYAFSVHSNRYGKRFKVSLRAYDKAGNVVNTAERTWRR